ncbi:MAG: hypothetical protein CVV04_11955 [Firmicutes bacterium HGW-Firmicutes-9]|jgi:ParB family chromosome partitioning protein|nr:MAG: hypothetical protein CVV04_11955 [Firmicutes bacterium HGW-Firmicutes-9]
MAKQSGFSILSTLNPQSLPGEERAANEFVVEMIPLKEIEPNADNFYNTEDIEALAEDIKQNGLMHNIVVGKRGDNGQYTLISGERRYRAFTLLNSQGNAGYKTIPAVVDGEKNPLLVKLKLISANATARELSDYEKSEQAAQIEQIAKQLKQQGLELPGRARDITAQVLGVSPAQAGRLTRIAHDLVPEVKEKFAAGDIGVTEAYDVATLPPEQQVQVVEARAAKQAEPKATGTAQPAKPQKPVQQAGEREKTRNKTTTWMDGFEHDTELMSTALCLEHWNEMACHPTEFKFLKSLVLQEAAMRKRRAE